VSKAVATTVAFFRLDGFRVYMLWTNIIQVEILVTPSCIGLLSYIIGPGGQLYDMISNE
jgi:hypothetical protein